MTTYCISSKNKQHGLKYHENWMSISEMALIKSKQLSGIYSNKVQKVNKVQYIGHRVMAMLYPLQVKCYVRVPYETFNQSTFYC